jgi:choline kinase
MKMKAIIIAAGLGSRLGSVTENLPKCLIDFDGKPLLQIQIDILNSFGITDISVIVGYKREKVNVGNVKYYVNDDYLNNNILESLFYAEDELNDDVIVSYCDILYEKKVISKIMQARDDISLVADVQWKDTYVGRVDHPLSEAENVVFDSNYHATSIGKGLPLEQVNTLAEFIGMFKLSAVGCEQLKICYHQSKVAYKGKVFHKAALFQRSYITDIMQELVDQGVPVSCTTIENGWREIDTLEDYEKAKKIARELLL